MRRKKEVIYKSFLYFYLNFFSTLFSSLMFLYVSYIGINFCEVKKDRGKDVKLLERVFYFDKKIKML